MKEELVKKDTAILAKEKGFTRDGWNGNSDEYPTRHDAEVDAFERAFEELEKKLKK